MQPKVNMQELGELINISMKKKYQKDKELILRKWKFV